MKKMPPKKMPPSDAEMKKMKPKKDEMKEMMKKGYEKC